MGMRDFERSIQRGIFYVTEFSGEEEEMVTQAGGKARIVIQGGHNLWLLIVQFLVVNLMMIKI